MAPQFSQMRLKTAVKARPNRRLHSRIPISREVCLCWQDRQGNHVLPAQAVDISKFGMGVEAERGVAPGMVVAVEAKATTLGRGCVRHCEMLGAKYRIGVHMPDRMTALLASVKH